MNKMIEIHRFGSYCPKHARYLLLGSFPGKEDEYNNWFYNTRRGQFWSIIEAALHIKILSIDDKKAFFDKYQMAVTDIIYSCERREGNNFLPLVNSATSRSG